MAVREDGDWEGWLRFFLRGVAATAEEATVTARAILQLREQHRALIQNERLGDNGQRVLDLLYYQPIIDVNRIKMSLSTSFGTASHLVKQLEQLGLLEEITGGRRNRRYRYQPYLALFAEPAPEADQQVPTQATESQP